MRTRHILVATVAALALLSFHRPAQAADPRVIEITARRFEFTPKVITLKQGEPVILRVKSEDVTHGFFERTLGLDADLEPGKPVDIPLTPKAPGRFTVICDHFCGAGHGNMNMTIVVE
ncbi:MAG TPA: cupredoxin domain-containing protein [Anaeromyxobacteraceae bacterium]|nr:cupredoxin domain-containing protein [Anaeromyxobacteraceae bacterium]